MLGSSDNPEAIHKGSGLILESYNPTATFIFDLRATPQYASPAYPIYLQETAYVTSLSDRR
jgi:hypothetical protein